MKETNIAGTGGEGTFFSSFRYSPAPAPPPEDAKPEPSPPTPAPAPPPEDAKPEPTPPTPAPAPPPEDAKPEPTPAKPTPAEKLPDGSAMGEGRAYEKQMLEYLKAKTEELEVALRASQEKVLALASEIEVKEDTRAIKLENAHERIALLEQRLTAISSGPPAPPDPVLLARFDDLAGKIASIFECLDAATLSARKEFQREAEELQTTVKQQQSLVQIELGSSRDRISILEQRLMGISTRPPAPPDPVLLARIDELAGKIVSISERLEAAALSASKEFRREEGELQAVVKKQQFSAEAEQLHASELKKSRKRIEALEKRLIEISSRPPAPPHPVLLARIKELDGKIESVSMRLEAAAGLPARIKELDGKIKSVSARLEAAAGLPARVKELDGKIESVSARLEAAAGLPARVKELDGKIESVSVRLEAAAGLPARIKELEGKIESVAVRLEAVAKVGVPPEEAEKLRSLLRMIAPRR